MNFALPIDEISVVDPYNFDTDPDPYNFDPDPYNFDPDHFSGSGFVRIRIICRNADTFVSVSFARIRIRIKRYRSGFGLVTMS